MTSVSLTYYHDSKNYGNFGDELSPFIISQLLSSDYTLTLNAPESDHSLLGIGSIIHLSKENDYVFLAHMINLWFSKKHKLDRDEIRKIVIEKYNPDNQLAIFTKRFMNG